MTTEPTAAERDSLVSVAGIPGYWARKTGGAIDSTVTEVWHGGRRDPENLGGPATTEDIVLTRPYKPSDRSWIDRLEPQIGNWRTTITVQDTTPALIAVGKPKVYPLALLRRLVPPDSDAASADPKHVELTFKAPRGR